MKIQVINVSVNHIPTAKGGYEVAEIAYKDLAKNAVAGKKIVSFNDKTLFEVVKGLKPNSFYEITMAKEAGKDGKDYWVWKAIVESDGSASAAPTASKGTAAPRSTYETPEERAVKQRYIARQSSLSNAIASLKVEKAALSPDEVMSVAERYFNWVYADHTAPAVDLNQDIPE